ncbi:MAG: PEP-utilizing enzyme [Gammaproteobacteria bacterium]|nr:PEP-utilizing enzyme [Gammaproteobacteria bacterium]
MEHRLAMRLADPAALDVALVGGKAASLARLRGAGFQVPEAELLTTHFFAPWIAEVTSAPEWQDIPNLLVAADGSNTDEVEARCSALLAHASRLEMDVAQSTAIDEIVDRFDSGAFAVRSSSPEEDRARASFAGLYESVLNVSIEGLGAAVRHCFAYCFDVRLLIYKARRNLDPQPRFAAFVQRQVASDTSGVAFSLNPHNNDFDEAVVNATKGLGDKLLAGEVDPDRWVIDKVTGKTLECRVGTAPGACAPAATLDETQLAALTKTLCAVESLFDCPVDVEWAVADGDLHLLQARPITTYVPLPEEIRTAPGEQRLLYMDPSLGEGITMSGAVSPMSVDLFAKLFEWLGDYVFGPSFLGPDLKKGIVGTAGVRLYGNLSHLMHFRDPRKVAPEKRFVDTTLAELFATADLEPYRVKPPPNLAPRRLVPALTKALLRLHPFFVALLQGLLRPKAFLERYADDLAAFDAEVASIDPDLPIFELARRLYAAVGRVSLVASAPAMLLFIYRGTEALMGLIDPSSCRERRLAMDIRGGGDELVLEMGLAMYRLARMLPGSAFGDLPALAVRIEARRMPAAFLARWDDFLHRFGCRGPLEMDLANPKYGDDPDLVLGQLATVALGDTDPVATHAERKRAREEAFVELSAALPAKKRRKLARTHRTIGALESVREMPKHHFATVNMVLRRRILRSARHWVAEGRLDRPEDVFQMALSDFDRAESDESLDLRAVVAERGAFYRDVKARVRHFPHLIDSRGRILRPVREYRPGELRGIAVSPGIVRGPVKVLDSPFDKTLLPGDVLVAHTTDPGWTPLFINAAAVLLEVGGELQHGALVAREYGKPCVAGIVGLMDSLQDGQVVEVDGDQGVVRVI